MKKIDKQTIVIAIGGALFLALIFFCSMVNDSNAKITTDIIIIDEESLQPVTSHDFIFDSIFDVVLHYDDTFEIIKYSGSSPYKILDVTSPLDFESNREYLIDSVNLLSTALKRLIPLYYDEGDAIVELVASYDHELVLLSSTNGVLDFNNMEYDYYDYTIK